MSSLRALKIIGPALGGTAARSGRRWRQAATAQKGYRQSLVDAVFFLKKNYFWTFSKTYFTYTPYEKLIPKINPYLDANVYHKDYTLRHHHLWHREFSNYVLMKNPRSADGTECVLSMNTMAQEPQHRLFQNLLVLCHNSQAQNFRYIVLGSGSRKLEASRCIAPNQMVGGEHQRYICTKLQKPNGMRWAC